MISSGSPHVRCTPMGRTCGGPDEIELTPMGVVLNGPGDVRLRHSDVVPLDHRLVPVKCSTMICFYRPVRGVAWRGGQFDFAWLPARATHPTWALNTRGEPNETKKNTRRKIRLCTMRRVMTYGWSKGAASVDHTRPPSACKVGGVQPAVRRHIQPAMRQAQFTPTKKVQQSIGGGRVGSVVHSSQK